MLVQAHADVQLTITGAFQWTPGTELSLIVRRVLYSTAHSKMETDRRAGEYNAASDGADGSAFHEK